jgi:hypothetical protein
MRKVPPKSCEQTSMRSVYNHAYKNADLLQDYKTEKVE